MVEIENNCRMLDKNFLILSKLATKNFPCQKTRNNLSCAALNCETVM